MDEREFILPTQGDLNKLWRSLHEDLPDFNFEWSSRRISTAGTIYYNKRLIVLSVKHYLEFGINEVIDTLKHEAAHYLALNKYNEKGHGQHFWYYLGYFRATRHCKSLSSNMREKRIRLVNQRRSNGIEYDPIAKTFIQRRG